MTRKSDTRAKVLVGFTDKTFCFPVYHKWRMFADDSTSTAPPLIKRKARHPGLSWSISPTSSYVRQPHQQLITLWLLFSSAEALPPPHQTKQQKIQKQQHLKNTLGCFCRGSDGSEHGCVSFLWGSWNYGTYKTLKPDGWIKKQLCCLVVQDPTLLTFL